MQFVLYLNQLMLTMTAFGVPPAPVPTTWMSITPGTGSCPALLSLYFMCFGTSVFLHLLMFLVPAIRQLSTLLLKTLSLTGRRRNTTKFMQFTDERSLKFSHVKT